jgi:transcriptional regulator with XRE-family HTH domain
MQDKIQKTLNFFNFTFLLLVERDIINYRKGQMPRYQWRCWILERQSPEIVGKRIRDIRLQLGRNMTQFAELINEGDATGKVATGTVNNWESGKNIPNAGRLRKIAELGRVSVEFLLTGNRAVTINNVLYVTTEILAKTDSKLHHEYAELRPEIDGPTLYELYLRVVRQMGFQESEKRLKELVKLVADLSFEKIMHHEQQSKSSNMLIAHFIFLALLDLDEEEFYTTKVDFKRASMQYVDHAVAVIDMVLESNGPNKRTYATDEMRAVVIAMRDEIRSIRNKYDEILTKLAAEAND